MWNENLCISKSTMTTSTVDLTYSSTTHQTPTDNGNIWPIDNVALNKQVCMPYIGYMLTIILVFVSLATGDILVVTILPVVIIALLAAYLVLSLWYSASNMLSSR